MMKFEIKINYNIHKYEPVLLVLLFSKDEEEYLNGCEDGIYSCAFMLPGDRSELLSLIEKSVNACIETYQSDKNA